jgi:hypothetical protein
MQVVQIDVICAQALERFGTLFLHIFWVSANAIWGDSEFGSQENLAALSGLLEPIEITD